MCNVIFDQTKEMDFIAVGRAGIDLNANEINRPIEETISFTRTVGGSPANIAVGWATLGARTGFIGKVSDDGFGKYIMNYFKEKNIDTSNLFIDKTQAVNGLAFTEIKNPRDCGALLYRDNVADLKLDIEDINENYIKNAKAILISGTALSKSPSREAIFVLLELARKHQTVVLFDIDYRAYSWNSPEETAVYYNLAAEKCDVIIGTREEFNMMEALTSPGNSDDHVSAKKWFSFNAKIVVVKHGKKGSVSYTREGDCIKVEAFPAKVKKTFGAGDAYASAFSFGLLKNWDLVKCMEFGSASSAMVISKLNCSEAMPTKEEIEDYIKKCRAGEIIEE